MSTVHSFHVQALVNASAPVVSSFHVQALVTDAVDPIGPSAPGWLPVYVLTDDGWIPTFPREQFDEHPPRG